MRIVQLSTMASFYGGEVHLVSLAEGLRSRGHEVLCVARPGSELARRLEGRGLEVRAMPLVDWFHPSSVARLSRLLKGLGPAILHTHLPRDYFLAAVASLGSQVVNVGTRHQLKPLSHTSLKRPFLKRFAAFIAVSEAVRQGFAATMPVDPARLRVIHHGLPDQEKASAAETARLRMLSGAGAGDPLVGFVGKLCPSKGGLTLLHAVARLAERWPRLRVCLVGEASRGSGHRRELEECVQSLGLADRVTFTGYRPLAGRLSSAFDIQVVPSVAEPFGLVTLEAMQAGVPVVASRSGGSPEIVRDGIEGFLFPPGDPAALIRKLDILLDSEGLRREMGRRGKKRARESFSHARMLDRTEDVYRAALGLAPLARREASA